MPNHNDWKKLSEEGQSQILAFIELQEKHKTTTLIPNPLMDLIWVSSLLSHTSLTRSLIQTTNFPLVDRTDQKAIEETKKLWKNEYKTDFLEHISDFKEQVKIQTESERNRKTKKNLKLFDQNLGQS